MTETGGLLKHLEVEEMDNTLPFADVNNDREKRAVCNVSPRVWSGVCILEDMYNICNLRHEK